jgi:hypothetical protein
MKIKSLASLLSPGVLKSPCWIDHTESLKSMFRKRKLEEYAPEKLEIV